MCGRFQLEQTERLSKRSPLSKYNGIFYKPYSIAAFTNLRFFFCNFFLIRDHRTDRWSTAVTFSAIKFANVLLVY